MRIILIILTVLNCTSLFAQDFKIFFEHKFEGGDMIWSNTPSTTVIVERKNDTVWRYVMENDKQIGDFLRIDKSGNLYYHAKIDHSINYRKYELFDSSDSYKLSEWTSDRKTILGFDCYKVNLERTSVDNIGPVTTLYSMYVTKQINLPLHTVINITKYFDFFPLEIIISGFSLDGAVEHYKAKYEK